MRTVWLERRKWPDRQHYAHHVTLLGDDDHGTWLVLLPGTPFHRGDQRLFVAPNPGIVVVPRDEWWMAWFPFDPDAFSLYVDIATPPVFDATAGTITMVDLDFDVVRWRDDARIELLDADEFEDHRVLYGYPPELEREARAAASRVHHAVIAGDEPFTGAPAHWIALAQQAIADSSFPPYQA